MTDPDIILYLYPNDGSNDAKNAMLQNKLRYIPPRHPDAVEPRDMPSRQDRESTEQPEEPRGLGSSACLVLRFSHGAKTHFGVVAGCAPNVDLLLRKQRGISRFHLAFTFDDKGRPIARDLGSRYGIKVIYDGEEGEWRSNFDYLLQGPRILGNKPPVLHISNLVQFKVVVPPHDITSPDYINRVARFRQGTADAEDLFASLVLRSAPGTQRPTGTHTPPRPSNPVLREKKLGEGAFGVVKHIWNAATGEEYALKEPLEGLTKNGRFRMENWKKEAKIMENISHDHIVAFRDATFSPWPKLIFEYVPGGSLDAYDDFSTLENVDVLCQLLSALQYLHGKNPPIGHRDIKPENILVLYRRSSGIYVKFADFGLAKAADYLKTFCGTPVWAAPELYKKAPNPAAAADDTYSVAVDIWSLGLVIASQERKLPKYERSYRTSAVAWIDVVLQHYKDYEREGNGLLSFLLDTMLVVDPQERKGASYCHDEAQRLSNCLNGYTSSGTGGSDEDSDPGTPTPSTLGTQPPMGHEGTPAETTAASIDLSLIANLGYRGTEMINSMVNSTESGTSQGSGTTTPSAQLRQGQDSSVVLPQGTSQDSGATTPSTQLRQGQDSSASFSSNHDAATIEADVSLLIRYHPGGGAQDNEAQPGRKRSWPEDGSPLASARQTHTDPTSGVAAPQRDNIVGQDDSSSRVLRASKRRKIAAAGEDPELG